MCVSKEQEWGYRETDFFFLSFTEVHTFSTKFRSRLHSMSFPFYKTKAGKVTEQVGLHGIPLSGFSSLCPAGTAKCYCLKSTSSNSARAPACFMELGDQPLTAAGPAAPEQQLWTPSLLGTRNSVPHVLSFWSSGSGFYQLSWWWFWCRWSGNYIWRTLV